MSEDTIQRLEQVGRFMRQVGQQLARYGLRQQQAQAHRHWVFLRDYVEEMRSTMGEPKQPDQPKAKPKAKSTRKVYADLIGGEGS